MDGYISFAINAQSEICSIVKPGSCGLTTKEIIKATRIAFKRSQELHVQLNKAILSLDAKILEEQNIRINKLRSLNSYNSNTAYHSGSQPISQNSFQGGNTIEKNDPILQWDHLHQKSILKDDE